MAAGGNGLEEHLKRMRRRNLNCDGRDEYTRLSTPIRGDKAVSVLPCEPAPHPIKRHQHPPSPIHSPFQVPQAISVSIQDACCNSNIQINQLKSEELGIANHFLVKAGDAGAVLSIHVYSISPD